MDILETVDIMLIVLHRTMVEMLKITISEQIIRKTTYKTLFQQNTQNLTKENLDNWVTHVFFQEDDVE